MSVNSTATASPIGELELPTIPVGKLAPWALFSFLLAAIVVFFVSADGGALSVTGGLAVHEWVHDGRHLLGFPCH
ncbi:MAG TPA: CbtB-domain containing protein [Aeromicrobium sp.]|jgi:hypothetical protein|nr:CbtB-domain containing protein [Aeromicrobium sp.]HKY58750.1 CbtB-domain containing protein [Aeromicrobium sp.]